MYYQLTLQFATSEIDDAKKVLELAKELDLKRAGLEEKLPEPEDFPWEEEKLPEPETFSWEEELAPKQKAPTKETPQAEATIPRAKDWVPMDEHAPEPVKPTPEPDQAPAKEITLGELQKAGVAFAKEKGMNVLKAFLAQMGASNISGIPKEKYQKAWEALHA